MQQGSPHSGPGIASFVIGILSGLGLFCMVVIAGLVEAASDGGMEAESGEAILIGLLMLAAGGLAFLGSALGLGGLCQSDRAKVFPAMGLVICLGVVLVTGLLFVAGIFMG